MSKYDIAELKAEIRDLRTQLRALEQRELVVPARHVRVARKSGTSSSSLQGIIFQTGEKANRSNAVSRYANKLTNPYTLVFEQDGKWFYVEDDNSSNCACLLIDTIFESQHKHTQSTPSTTWTISHQFGQNAEAAKFFVNGEEVVPHWENTDQNTVTATFAEAQSGEVLVLKQTITLGEYTDLLEACNCVDECEYCEPGTVPVTYQVVVSGAQLLDRDAGAWIQDPHFNGIHDLDPVYDDEGERMPCRYEWKYEEAGWGTRRITMMCSHDGPSVTLDFQREDIDAGTVVSVSGDPQDVGWDPSDPTPFNCSATWKLSDDTFDFSGWGSYGSPDIYLPGPIGEGSDTFEVILRPKAVAGAPPGDGIGIDVIESDFVVGADDGIGYWLVGSTFEVE